jgi:hypothetical protein
MDYKAFVDFLFNRDSSAEWYFDLGFESPDLPAEVVATYATRLFQNIGGYADALSERTVCLGLNFVINPSCSNFSFAFFDVSVPERSRIDLIASMFEVFRQCFSRKCSNQLSHKETVASLTYNNVCYMWWDVLPRHGVPQQPALESADAAIIDVLTKILALDSIACVESAIHGLGHWHAAYPDSVAKIIRASAPMLPSSLRAYAAAALAGNIQ